MPLFVPWLRALDNTVSKVKDLKIGETDVQSRKQPTSVEFEWKQEELKQECLMCLSFVPFQTKLHVLFLVIAASFAGIKPCALAVNWPRCVVAGNGLQLLDKRQKGRRKPEKSVAVIKRVLCLVDA